MPSPDKNIIWWGRSDTQYSRNGIIRQLLEKSGLTFTDFRPKFSRLGALQAQLTALKPASLVWVPCFRQRDVLAARRWCDKKHIPLIFDPLISAYDKQVFERNKFSENSAQAKKLLQWEQVIFQAADTVIADTAQHAEFFADVLGVSQEKLRIIPVSADEQLFNPMPVSKPSTPKRLRVLFYGSFLQLHGVDAIAKAILMLKEQPIDWTLIGTGPMHEMMQNTLSAVKTVEWLDWVDYAQLPHQIAKADAVLGVFGAGAKASRVIPNKVYQALACGRAVVTMNSAAYPEALRQQENSGITWVPANDAQALHDKLLALLTQDTQQQGENARETYLRWFSNSVVSHELRKIIDKLDQKTE